MGTVKLFRGINPSQFWSLKKFSVFWCFLSFLAENSRSLGINLYLCMLSRHQHSHSAVLVTFCIICVIFLCYIFVLFVRCHSCRRPGILHQGHGCQQGILLMVHGSTQCSPAFVHKFRSIPTSFPFKSTVN